MRAVYFDCYAGVSGDMIIGAQLDLGVDLERLKEQLSTLGLKDYKLSDRRVKRSNISAIKFDVEVQQSAQPRRTLDDIRSIVLGADASDWVKAKSIEVFERLANAEARVHGTTPEKVHFHEVGAVDSIIDIVGSMIGFEMLGVRRFFCSPLRVGAGAVQTDHGRLPVPAPATAELLRDVPVYAGDLEGEFVTPTGAAIVGLLCEEFGPLPRMTMSRIGYGAGSRDPAGFPNALRLIMGEISERDATQQEPQGANQPGRVAASAQVHGTQTEVYVTSDETIVVVETNIDDMNPQAYGFVMERAFALGALDVFMSPVQMKKDRPGVLLTVLCKPEDRDPVIEMILAETTTLGVRYYEAARRVLERSIEPVETLHGTVRIKVARRGARTLHFQPEYEDCARLAMESKSPLLEVMAAASAAYRAKMSRESRETGEHG